MNEKRRESIVDASRPSAGRVYDYLLGGHHNFEVDRRVAERIKEILPFMPKAFMLQRWCLQDVAMEVTRRGLDVIIDFASGLPTQDHIHTVVPAGTIVIYSDYDPVVVGYARDILGDMQNVYYFEADARQPEELLNRPEVQDILGGRRDVALVMWGVSAFLSDDELAHAAQVLYEWSGPRSCLAFNAQAADVDEDNPIRHKIHALYEQMGTPLHNRSLERARLLLQPWRLGPEGFTSLFDWHGIDTSVMTEMERKVFGTGGAGYGAYFVK
ncbi:MAG: hypothetical protein D6775_08335 [Caldilineae bacterium]|nr:MAG: hypothetical protein D6775_08335 [Caldilineae bacterium]